MAALAALTAFAIFKQIGWASLTAQATGLSFFAYAGYQIVSAVFLLSENQAPVLSGAILYALIGVTAVALGRKLKLAVN